MLRQLFAAAAVLAVLCGGATAQMPSDDTIKGAAMLAVHAQHCFRWSMGIKYAAQLYAESVAQKNPALAQATQDEHEAYFQRVPGSRRAWCAMIEPTIPMQNQLIERMIANGEWSIPDRRPPGAPRVGDPYRPPIVQCYTAANGIQQCQ